MALYEIEPEAGTLVGSFSRHSAHIPPLLSTRSLLPQAEQVALTGPATACAAGCAASLLIASAAWSGANDYAFEPVKAEIKKGDGATVAVRIIDKRSGKAVSDAVIFSPRVDMSPEGMATMTAAVTPAAG